MLRVPPRFIRRDAVVPAHLAARLSLDCTLVLVGPTSLDQGLRWMARSVLGLV